MIGFQLNGCAQFRITIIPTTQDRHSPLLSPAEQNYAAYPPTLFQVGDYELLCDDSIRFYQILRQQQHQVYLEVISGLAHCWHFFVKRYEPGRIALQQMSQFLNQYF